MLNPAVGLTMGPNIKQNSILAFHLTNLTANTTSKSPFGINPFCDIYARVKSYPLS